jgi:two-component system sensor histidine kinase KdpD
VRDHGAGLSPGEEDAIFERFHRGRAGHSGTEGTGLGLAIARDLARRWGGDVTLENASGGGALATVELALPDLSLDLTSRLPARA